MQKKRLIALEKNKYSAVVSKIEAQIQSPINEIKKQYQLALSFLNTDVNRAKLEFNKISNQIDSLSKNTDNLIKKHSYIEPDQALCDSLNSYIGDLSVIYPDIKFQITVANLKLINRVNCDLNRCLMAFFRGMINTFILKCNPSEINLRFAYHDGYLKITGTVVGNYINFYSEMKTAYTSIIANVYEKVFLLDGDLSFVDLKNGTFSVKSTIPIKNYLA